MKNIKGFSLMELMVVVAIIAILSTIAVPGFKVYQAKARQKEGFNLMSSYYSAARNTQLEFGFYPGEFVQTGFQPAGQLGYRIEVMDNAQDIVYADPRQTSFVPMDTGCINTDAICNCGGMCANFKTWTGTVGIIGAQFGSIACDIGTGCGDSMISNTAFTVLSCGVISTTATVRDQYSITETKAISLCSDGLQ